MRIVNPECKKKSRKSSTTGTIPCTISSERRVKYFLKPYQNTYIPYIHEYLVICFHLSNYQIVLIGLVDLPEEERTTGPVDNKEDIIRGDPKIGAPLDLEFELGMVDPEIEPPMLTLPLAKD
jgi:hypothetical protein